MVPRHLDGPGELTEAPGPGLPDPGHALINQTLPELDSRLVLSHVATVRRRVVRPVVAPRPRQLKPSVLVEGNRRPYWPQHSEHRIRPGSLCCSTAGRWREPPGEPPRAHSGLGWNGSQVLSLAGHQPRTQMRTTKPRCECDYSKSPVSLRQQTDQRDSVPRETCRASPYGVLRWVMLVVSRRRGPVHVSE